MVNAVALAIALVSGASFFVIAPRYGVGSSMLGTHSMGVFCLVYFVIVGIANHSKIRTMSYIELSERYHSRASSLVLAFALLSAAAGSLLFLALVLVAFRAHDISDGAGLVLAFICTASGAFIYATLLIRRRNRGAAERK